MSDDYSSSDCGGSSSYDSGSSHSCSVPDTTPCGPMSDQGSVCGPSEPLNHPGMQDLLLYGMSIEMLTVDEKSGKPVRARISPDEYLNKDISPRYLSPNVDIPNRGETRYESDRRAEKRYGGEPVTEVHVTDVSPPLEIRQELEGPARIEDAEFWGGFLSGVITMSAVWFIWWMLR
jgi:hypothetical protein